MTTLQVPLNWGGDQVDHGDEVGQENVRSVLPIWRKLVTFECPHKNHRRVRNHITQNFAPRPPCRDFLKKNGDRGAARGPKRSAAILTCFTQLTLSASVIHHGPSPQSSYTHHRVTMSKFSMSYFTEFETVKSSLIIPYSPIDSGSGDSPVRPQNRPCTTRSQWRSLSFAPP